MTKNRFSKFYYFERQKKSGVIFFYMYLFAGKFEEKTSQKREVQKRENLK